MGLIPQRKARNSLCLNILVSSQPPLYLIYYLEHSSRLCFKGPRSLGSISHTTDIGLRGRGSEVSSGGEHVPEVTWQEAAEPS